MRHSQNFILAGLPCLWRQGAIAGFGLTLAASVDLFTPTAAMAQAAYGSYVGIGVSAGVTSGDRGEPSKVAGVVAARYKFLTLPISVRTQVLIGDGVAIVPTVSYDIPLNWRTDAYIGAGAAIAFEEDPTTPIGNRTTFAIQPGIDHVLPNSNLVVFGNAVIAFDAYRRGGGTAASFQGGVGIRF
jgi:hypothetical protein